MWLYPQKLSNSKVIKTTFYILFFFFGKYWVHFDYGSILKMKCLGQNKPQKLYEVCGQPLAHSTKDTKMNAKEDFFLKSFLLPLPPLWNNHQLPLSTGTISSKFIFKMKFPRWMVAVQSSFCPSLTASELSPDWQFESESIIIIWLQPWRAM